MGNHVASTETQAQALADNLAKLLKAGLQVVDPGAAMEAGKRVTSPPNDW